MSATSLAAKARTELGTGASRALRRNGMVPATVYGKGKDPLSVSIEEKEVTKLYRKKHFSSSVLELDIDGKKHKVLPKSVSLHPITDIVHHVDFVFLDDKMQRVDVPIVFDGKERCLGVKRGGFFNVIMRKLPLMCNVSSIPKEIVVDVVEMVVGDTVRSVSMALPSGTSLFSKKDLVIASITGRSSKTDDLDDAPVAGTEGAEGEGSSEEASSEGGDKKEG
jgi:large subunit ribosomal protein L25